MSESLLALLKNEDGATLTEYSLIVGLIAVACVFSLRSLSSNVQILLNSATTKF
jgi:Flp pilus assembly pilin Flp